MAQPLAGETEVERLLNLREWMDGLLTKVIDNHTFTSEHRLYVRGVRSVAEDVKERVDATLESLAATSKQAKVAMVLLDGGKS